MAEQIYIGNVSQGLTSNRLPFNIDNDAFPTLYNMYSWRGRIKRKRGTKSLLQLQRNFTGLSLGSTTPFEGLSQIAFGDILALLNFNEVGATLVPGSIIVIIGSITAAFTDLGNGTFAVSGTGVSAGSFINYATGLMVLNLSAPISGGLNIAINLKYYPGLPVMGLEDFTSSVTTANFPISIFFDTTYAYQVNQTVTPPVSYQVDYYKLSQVQFIWNGQDYQQFWSTNYSGAFWATNNVPGLNLVTASAANQTGTAITFSFTYPSYSPSHGAAFTTLVAGDVLWFNEWNTGGSTINGFTGVVTSGGGGTYVITFASSVTVSGTGIAQLLTNTIGGQDGIKWYDGDPTGLTGIPTALGKPFGWVNFNPPLTANPTGVGIDNYPVGVYYLAGALAILPFKDRLLFFSPWVMTSGGFLVQLIDIVLWSWNGTPFYTYDTTLTASAVPVNQTADVRAYYVDQTGFGGYLPAGIPQPIQTVSNNEDALIIGFGGDGRKTRFVYTGDDLQPFLFFNINSELPSQSTFSAVPLDRGVLDIGQYGIAMTDQQSSARVDLVIPQEVFTIQMLNNGNQRVNAIRDFYKEWVYFSYPVNTSLWKFPTQTFLFNYRDNTWAILYENWTHHGIWRAQNKRTWRSTGFKTWAAWREPWNAGTSSAFVPQIIAGNPQGYVLIIGEGTGESPSGTINAIAASVNPAGTLITSYNHCVAVGDYLYITGALGVTPFNMLIGQVPNKGIIDANNFVIDIPFPTGAYLGLGQYTRLSVPVMQTKQFPVYWDQGRQCRLSCQKYLMDTTSTGQVTVYIYLSQNPLTAWNYGPIVPSIDVLNNSLIYSQIMYTCYESTNLGLIPASTNMLNPANTNLQMLTAISGSQKQIWHRFNTSLIGDSVQIGITLSDAQMRDYTNATNEVTLHGMHLTVEKAGYLA